MESRLIICIIGYLNLSKPDMGGFLKHKLWHKKKGNMHFLELKLNGNIFILELILKFGEVFLK